MACCAGRPQDMGLDMDLLAGSSSDESNQEWMDRVNHMTKAELWEEYQALENQAIAAMGQTSHRVSDMTYGRDLCESEKTGRHSTERSSHGRRYTLSKKISVKSLSSIEDVVESVFITPRQPEPEVKHEARGYEYTELVQPVKEAQNSIHPIQCDDLAIEDDKPKVLATVDSETDDEGLSEMAARLCRREAHSTA